MKKLLFCIATISIVFCQSTFAQETETPKPPASQELALKLANPVAAMISVPFQFNTMLGVGPYNGSQLVTNFQPVIPFTLGKITMVTRTIVPFIENRNVLSPGSTQFGISDVNFTAFFTPTKAGKFIWGVGPALSIPTASEPYFGAEKWEIGPSAVFIKQTKSGWSYILLVRQVWSFAGDKDRADVSPFFINPGIGHSFKSGAGLGANVEIAGDWKNSGNTQSYLNLSASMVSKFGKQPVSFSLGPRIPLSSETLGEWGIRAGFVLIFSKV
ncbi:hypothetical protein ACSVH5_03395 [Flavobacterium sp. RSSA_27]|uniref:hypothetical protein n=1 Tax=Flavobacterium sp. RSSA_27 TaxID=3447667 RepID=UPI003F2FF673